MSNTQLQVEQIKRRALAYARLAQFEDDLAEAALLTGSAVPPRPRHP